MDVVDSAVAPVDTRRQLTAVTLALVTLIAALAVWAGIAWASGGAVPPPSDIPRVVFTQANTSPADGHRCHNGGGAATNSPSSGQDATASL